MICLQKTDEFDFNSICDDEKSMMILTILCENSANNTWNGK